MKEDHWYLVCIGAGLSVVLIVFGTLVHSMRPRPEPPPAATEVAGKIVVQDSNGCTWIASSDGFTSLATDTQKCREAR